MKTPRTLALSLLVAAPLAATSALALDNRLPQLPGGPGGIVFEPLPPLPPDQVCQNAIDARLAALRQQGRDLGAPTAPLFLQGQICYRDYANGTVYSTAHLGGSGAIALFGPVLAKYNALGRHASALSRPITEPAVDAQGQTRSQFLGGVINVHPVFGSFMVQAGLSSLWQVPAVEARFGPPLVDPTAMPGNIGHFSVFDNGFGGFVPSMGAWMDFTGVSAEGQVGGVVTLYQNAAFGGLANGQLVGTEAPIRLRAQLASVDNQASSAVVESLPATTSTYLFDGPALTGNFVRITGAGRTAAVRVSDLGPAMNDRTSSLLLANHGTASLRLTAAQLASMVDSALENFDVDALIDEALSDSDASGSLDWTTPVTLTIRPEERTVQITRTGYMDVNADCALVFNCNADGPVRFDVWMRPQIDGRFKVRADFVRGTATSLSCSGRGCGERANVLSTLFSRDGVASGVRDAVNAKLGEQELALTLLGASCDNEVNVRRINVLPGFLEVVLADTAAAGACALATAGDQLDTARPAGLVENADGTRIVNGVTIVNRPRGGVVGPVLGAAQR